MISHFDRIAFIHKNCMKHSQFTIYQSFRLIQNTFIYSYYHSISTGKKYPFYGLQFHPEKPAFEWHPKLDIKHTSEAVKIGQYFADFFIDEARKNKNGFQSYEEEMQYIIDRYPATYTAFNINSTMPFDGIYMF